MFSTETNFVPYTDANLELAIMVAVMKEVAVIGAGSAGLVASRHLVRCGIRPTIFEASLIYTLL